MKQNSLVSLFSDLFRYYVIEVIILKTFDETETHYQNRLMCLAVYFVGFSSIIIRISSLRKTNKVVLYDVYSVVLILGPDAVRRHTENDTQNRPYATDYKLS